MKTLAFLFILLFFASCSQNEEEIHFPYFGYAIDGYPITKEKLETLLNPDLIVFYLQWHQKDLEELLNSLNAIWDSDCVPCITWEPMEIIENAEKTIPYQDILNGKWDTYISDTIKIIQNFKKPVMIRFAHEMNLSRYHWGSSYEEFGPESVQIYKKMHTYLYQKFKEKSVKNALFVFCPNADSIPNEKWNNPIHYYPGNEQISLLGMDGYNWNLSSDLAKAKNLNWSSPNRSFEQIFKNLHEKLLSLNSKKPLLVFETASATRKAEDKKSLWLKEAIRTAKKWQLLAITWFQADKEENWALKPEDVNILPSHGTFQSFLSNYFYIDENN
jgi:mannan endo-1,4-beta-mannosidase